MNANATLWLIAFTALRNLQRALYWLLVALIPCIKRFTPCSPHVLANALASA